jgi:U3 small nucleolar ribonucleoprotein component
MKNDWIIAVSKGWVLWHYVLFRDGEPVAYGLALSERGAWANGKNRRDRIIKRKRTESEKRSERARMIARKTVV